MSRIRQLGMGDPASTSVYATYLVALSAAGLVIINSFFWTFPTFFRDSGSMEDNNGNKIKELKSDSRLAKFAASLELSEKGKELADDDPYIIHNGNSRELVITQPYHVRDFYKNDARGHPKPRNLNMGEYFGRILGDAVGAKAGDRWRVIRSYFDPEFTPAISVKAIPNFSARISEWIDRLPASAVTVPSIGGSFILDVKMPCKFLPFQLVAIQLYGDAFNDKLYSKLLEINELHEMILHDVILNKRLVSKLWNLFPTAAKKRMDLYVKQWELINLGTIQYARENEVFCPAERIYRGVDQAQDMTNTEFLHTVDEILFANVDISSAVLNTVFTKLAESIEFQSALRAEFQEQKTQEDFELAKYVSKQDSLLNFLIMESMRLTPAFWFSLPECTSTAKNIGGYSIPPNTSVIIDARRLNTDPITWGPDGNTFRPERFADIPQSTCRYGFMRFGVGAASGKCLGKNVADIIFKLTSLAVLDRYLITSIGKGTDEAVSSEVLFTPL